MKINIYIHIDLSIYIHTYRALTCQGECVCVRYSRAPTRGLSTSFDG